jgi:hypothetical protein
MKTRFGLGVVGVCGALVGNGFGQEPASAAVAAPPAAPSSSAVASPSTPAVPAPTTTAEALQKLGVPAPRYPAHPPPKKPGERAQATGATSAKIIMATPPPPSRAETKPAAPAGNFVWVPGHYVPLNNEWRWVAGEWGVPATPASVWIEASYDPKTKSWSPGYWQPDRPETYDPGSPGKAAGNGY